MFKPNDYSFKIEVTARAIFKPGDFGLGLVFDSEFIKNNPFIPISLVLGNFYNKIDDNSKIKIDDFIEKYHWQMDKTIEELGEDEIVKTV